MLKLSYYSVILIVIFYSLYIMYFDDYYSVNSVVRPKLFSYNHYSLVANKSSDEKIFTEQKARQKQFKILIWTALYKQKLQIVNLTDIKCHYSNCALTSDRRQLHSSDAVFFHLIDINKNDMPGGRHLPNQSYVLFDWEPPSVSPVRRVYPIANDTNWVLSYRQDSDIYYQYGRVVKCNTNWKLRENLFHNKTKSVAWIVSKCVTTGKREVYVHELRKHIDVDIYGKCGTMKCWPRYSPKCDERIANQYKFYLSFENSLCRDYVTEKLFRILQYDIIPVVYGSAIYQQIMPNNSYIDARKFRSPQELASFLKDVANDQIKYNSYLTWKSEYCSELQPFNYPPKYICNLCEKLNSEYSGENTSYKVKKNLINWLYAESRCKSGVT